MRVAIYARYSSDNQRDASIADQLRICREFAARQGWTVVQEYPDHAVSGATLLRSGFQALMRAALNRHFDVVLAESLDRFSRDQEDTAGLFKRLTFAGVDIVTLAEGDITHLHIGCRVVAGPRLELTPSLEAQDDGIVRLPVLGDGRMELRQALQAGELVEDEPHGPLYGLGAGHRRSTSMSSQRLVRGTSRVRVSGVLVRKIHLCRSRAQAEALQRRAVSVACGSSFSVSATMVSVASTPPRCAGARRSMIEAYGVPWTR